MGRLETKPRYSQLATWTLSAGLLVSCGADRSDTSGVSGTWSGQLYQASGINCSDGSFIGAGLGTPTRVITVQVTGGEAIGEEAALSLDSCTMMGGRVTASSMEFSSTATGCPQVISFSGINGGMATLHINPGPPEATTEGTVGCAIAESGEIALDEALE